MNELNPAEIFRDWDFVDDRGDYAAHRACAMSAAVALVRLRKGEPLGLATDHLDCVDEVIRQLVITRNDKTPDEERKSWAIGIIPRIIDTATGDAVSRERAERVARYACARYACTVIAPEALDAAGLHDHAERLRGLSGATLEELRGVAHAAASAAAAFADDAAYDAAYYAASNAARAASYAGQESSAYAAVRCAVNAASAAKPLRHLDTMIELCLQAKQ